MINLRFFRLSFHYMVRVYSEFIVLQTSFGRVIGVSISHTSSTICFSHPCVPRNLRRGDKGWRVFIMNYGKE